MLFGRLGFERSGVEDLWDEDKKDFMEQEVPGGIASPFAVALDSLNLVFQTRSQDIRVTGFIGAMQGILRDATNETGWKIQSVQREMTFEAWRATVQRVSRVHFNVRPPNPNYEGRPDLERLIENAHLGRASFDFASDENINTDADLIAELLDHVGRGYGSAVAVGERTVDEGAVETVYNSEMQGAADVRERPADPATGEVQADVLREELTLLAAEEEPNEHG